MAIERTDTPFMQVRTLSRPKLKRGRPVHEQTGLTRSQFLMWLSQESAPEVPLFNELNVFVVDGAIDRGLFDRAVQEVVDGTEALRTIVRRVNGLPRAEVLDHITASPGFIDMSGEFEPQAALERWARLHADSTIDIATKSFEMTLIKLSDSQYAWALLQHHLITDAQSIAIVFERVGDAYGRCVVDRQLESCGTSRYADYVDFVRSLRDTDQFAKSEAFWNARTSEPPDPLTFYDGRALSTDDGFRRVRSGYCLGIEQSEALRQLSRREGIRFLSDDLTSFSVVVAAARTCRWTRRFLLSVWRSCWPTPVRLC